MHVAAAASTLVAAPLVACVEGMDAPVATAAAVGARIACPVDSQKVEAVAREPEPERAPAAAVVVAGTASACAATLPSTSAPSCSANELEVDDSAAEVKVVSMAHQDTVWKLMI